MTGRHVRRRSAPWSVIGVLLVLAVTGPLLVTDSGPVVPTMAAASVAPLPEAAPAAPPDTPEPPPVQRGLAQAAVNAAEQRASSGTQLGVAVLDRTTGELAVGGLGHERFYTASLAKLIVIVDVLDRRRTEGLQVTDADRQLFARALGPSDDSAMNALWERFDGAGARGAGERPAGPGGHGGAAPDRPVGRGRGDGGRLRRAVEVRARRHAGRRPRPAALGHGGRSRDGEGRLRPGVRACCRPTCAGRVRTLAKQGWMCCFSGQYYLHSAGAVGPEKRFLVVMLTRQPRTKGWPAARTELTGIATQAVAALG